MTFATSPFRLFLLALLLLTSPVFAAAKPGKPGKKSSKDDV